MSMLVDTNVLLRRTQPDHQLYTVAVESIAQILGTGEPVYFTLQNISEFWNVVTRPVANNGLGFAPAMALAEVEKIERILTRLPDTAAVYAEWKRLVVQHSVIGSKVHDARLVATMNVHGVHRILTFNTDDFTRYGIEVLHPTSLLSQSATDPAPDNSV
jgi:predicted nucleic acid-binding protein